MLPTLQIEDQLDALHSILNTTEILMAEQPQDPNAIIHFLNNSWHWILSILTGAAWTGTLQNRVKHLENATSEMKELPLQVARLETKIDILLADRRQG